MGAGPAALRCSQVGERRHSQPASCVTLLIPESITITLLAV
jgi:hypothetical protein